MLPDALARFDPPRFRPHPLLVSGHLQTLTSLSRIPEGNLPTERRIVSLDDGDAIVLHDDRPQDWRAGKPALLLIHGLCGCHTANYMIRLAKRFFARGVRVFRVDLRGCGAGRELASGVSHAGRSDDVLSALDAVSRWTSSGPLGVVGVSLGGNLLLRGFGRIGGGLDPRPEWWDRIDRAVAVAPPLDLIRCSNNMERLWLRPYNRFFIGRLLARIPERTRARPEYLAAARGALPKTMRELDERFTAPLSGFSGAHDYYRQSSSAAVVRSNPVRTLILAAADDPIVPIDCFLDRVDQFPATTRLLTTRRGGHVGFVGRRRRSWMDQVIVDWFRPDFTD